MPLWRAADGPSGQSPRGGGSPGPRSMVAKIPLWSLPWGGWSAVAGSRRRCRVGREGETGAQIGVDPDGLVQRYVDPGVHAGQVARVGDRPGRTGDHDAPAQVRGGVEVVGLVGHDDTVDTVAEGGGGRGAGVGADMTCPLVEDVVDRADRRHAAWVNTTCPNATPPNRRSASARSSATSRRGMAARGCGRRRP